MSIEPLPLNVSIAVLNQKRHRGREDWILDDPYPGQRFAVVPYTDICLEEFEVIAIAERYLRTHTEWQATRRELMADGLEVAVRAMEWKNPGLRS